MSQPATAARAVAKRTVRSLSSTALRATGLDVTDVFAARSCLVVAPHPDDETLGCGAAIARMRSAGTAVHVVFVTGGGQSPKPAEMTTADLIALRRAEAVTALSVLGVDESCVTHWDFDDGLLAEHGDEITAALAELVHTTSIEQVLVTSAGDRHPDHVAVGQATRSAVSGSASPPVLFEYPIWQRVPAVTAARHAARARQAGSPATARPRLVRTDPFLAHKRAALSAYASQHPHFPLGFVDDFLLRHESFTEVARPGTTPR